MSSSYSYLSEKVLSSEFQSEPFEHIVIDDFLSRDDFARLQRDQDVHFEAPSSSEELIATLFEKGYEVHNFPGCTTNVEDYLRKLRNNKLPNSGDGPRRLIEGYGLTFRLKKYTQESTRKVIEYLNGEEYISALVKKFGIVRPTRIDTAIQKNLTGYEISPHPDIRSKCLTYLLNINLNEAVSDLPIHTHLLKFKSEKQFIYEFWRHNLDIDRCWVPWDWCDTVKTISKNNSIVLFATGDKSLHAVKLVYDHLPFQRTQIYGNLWHTDVPLETGLAFDADQFDLRGFQRDQSILKKIMRRLSHMLKNFSQTD